MTLVYSSLSTTATEPIEDYNCQSNHAWLRQEITFIVFKIAHLKQHTQNTCCESKTIEQLS